MFGTYYYAIDPNEGQVYEKEDLDYEQETIPYFEVEDPVKRLERQETNGNAK